VKSLSIVSFGELDSYQGMPSGVPYGKKLESTGLVAAPRFEIPSG